MIKICFAQEMYFPLQSTQALSAYLKNAGHQTDLAIGRPNDIVDYVLKTKPDLIAFSVLTAYRNHMLAVSSAIKDAGIKIPIIAGGYDITFMPQILENSDLDMICVGEGGEPIVELANEIDKGSELQKLEIGNIHFKQTNGKIVKNPMRYWLMDLDKAPFDDRDIYWEKDDYFKIVPFTQILAGRGCPYPCTYCFNDGYKKIHMENGMAGKEYTNFRSVGHVINELKMLSEKYDAKDFFFNDSTLTWNKKWIIDFCKAYKESGLKQTFSINAVIPELSEEVCKALASTSKCRLIRWGLETGNDSFRIKTLRKAIKNDQIIEVTDRLNRHGLRYSMQMMLGLPGESKEYAWDTIDMARRVTGKTGVHGINIFKPFPGLEINNIGLELGEYQASDVVAPGSVLPPTLSKESREVMDSPKEEVYLPEDEAYLTSRASMHKTGSDQLGNGFIRNEEVYEDDRVDTDNPYSESNFGTRNMVFYDNYRRDRLGRYILKLSRYSHIAIRFPGLRPIIEKLIQLPDNTFNRAVWKATEGLLNIRVHAGAPWSYFVKYLFFHAGKQVR